MERSENETGWATLGAAGLARAYEGRIAMMTPLERIRDLQARVRRAHRINDGLPIKVLCDRFGITPDRARALLLDELAIPAKYKQTARRLRVDPRLITFHKEGGRDFCRLCKQWSPVSEFYDSNGSNLRHRRRRCPGERPAPQVDPWAADYAAFLASESAAAERLRGDSRETIGGTDDQ